METFVPNPTLKIRTGAYNQKPIMSGSCSDSGCQNYFASTSCNHCPKTRLSKSEHCESDKKRCQKCKSNFIDSDRSICETCMITYGMIQCYGCQTEIERDKSWVPQAKAYLCTSCQHMHCKSCGRSDLSLNIEGFCYECANAYEAKGFCIGCGDFKYVNLHTETCHQCEDKLYG